eukprot:366268-Chlamydomonas_euryale.AAC.26
MSAHGRRRWGPLRCSSVRRITAPGRAQPLAFRWQLALAACALWSNAVRSPPSDAAVAGAARPHHRGCRMEGCRLRMAHMHGA